MRPFSLYLSLNGHSTVDTLRPTKAYQLVTSATISRRSFSTAANTRWLPHCNCVCLFVSLRRQCMSVWDTNTQKTNTNIQSTRQQACLCTWLERINLGTDWREGKEMIALLGDFGGWVKREKQNGFVWQQERIMMKQRCWGTRIDSIYRLSRQTNTNNVSQNQLAKPPAEKMFPTNKQRKGTQTFYCTTINTTNSTVFPLQWLTQIPCFFRECL